MARPRVKPGVSRVRQDRRPGRDSRLALIEGSLSARGIARHSPWVANLHRLSDGTLVGLGFCMLALSGLTLHWQARWGQSYQDLETTQALEHRLQEGSALLEQNHLAAVRRPGQLVATRSEKLVFLPPPPQYSAAPRRAGSPAPQHRPISPGY